MSQQPNNHRKHQRHAAELSASLEDIDNTLSVAVLNISEGGVFIRCDDPPACWQNVKLTMELASEERTVEAEGVVVWRVAAAEIDQHSDLMPGAGIQFVKIDPDDLALLTKLIQKKG